MRFNPIIVVAGEPNSIFLEIFFKSLKKKVFKSPIILIASKKIVLSQMKKLKFNFKIKIINENKLNLKKTNNKEINLIDINYNSNKIFEKISSKTNEYIRKSFSKALILLKKKNFKQINKWTNF